MRQEDGEVFEQSLRGLNVLFKKGYISVFMTYVDLMRKMMNHFTKLGRQLEVPFVLFWLGWDQWCFHWISYALCAFNNCLTYSRKSQILFSLYQKIFVDCLSYWLRIIGEIISKKGYFGYFVCDLWKFFTTKPIGE